MMIRLRCTTFLVRPLIDPREVLATGPKRPPYIPQPPTSLGRSKCVGQAGYEPVEDPTGMGFEIRLRGGMDGKNYYFDGED